MACSHAEADPNNLPFQKGCSSIIFHDEYLGKSIAPANR